MATTTTARKEANDNKIELLWAVFFAATKSTYILLHQINIFRQLSRWHRVIPINFQNLIRTILQSSKTTRQNCHNSQVELNFELDMQHYNRHWSGWNYLSLISQNGFYAIENQWRLLLDTNCHSSNKMVHLKCEHMHFNDNFKWLAMQQWCIFYVRKTRVLIFCDNFIYSSVRKINGSTVFVNQNFCIWRSIWMCEKHILSH